MTIDVLVSCRSSLFRSAIKSVIDGERSLQVLAEASTPEETLDRLKERCPDVHLLVYEQHQDFDLAFLDELTERFPSVKTLVMSLISSEYDAAEIVRSAAAG